MYTSDIIRDETLLNDITDLFKGQSVRFPVSYDQFPEGPLEISVNNYNALFESNLKFDRDTFHYVLTNKCQILVNYRPSSYQGLNITYYLTHNGKTERVTFFAFQDGTIMITGNNNWEVIETSYHQMCQIIDTYYSEIVSIEKREIKNQNTLPKFEQVMGNISYTFLNKKSLIINNPRNNYILKSKGLVKYYL